MVFLLFNLQNVWLWKAYVQVWKFISGTIENGSIYEMKSAFLKFCPYIKTAINFVYLFMNNPVSVNFLYSLTDCNIDLIKLICYSESELFHCKKIWSKNRQYFFMVYRIRACGLLLGHNFHPIVMKLVTLDLISKLSRRNG